MKRLDMRREWASAMYSAHSDENSESEWFNYSDLLTDAELTHDLMHRFTATPKDHPANTTRTVVYYVGLGSLHSAPTVAEFEVCALDLECDCPWDSDDDCDCYVGPCTRCGQPSHAYCDLDRYCACLCHTDIC